MLTVAFDLDGTLVRGSSFGQFTRLLIGRSPWRLLVAAVTLPALWLAVRLRLRRPRDLDEYLVWLATTGRTEHELRGRARHFAHVHAGPGSGNRIGRAIALVRAHQEAGHRVLVVTASPSPIGDEVVRAAGLVGVEVVAPRLLPRRGGWVPADPGTGPEKVRRLAARGVQLPLLAAYTDHVDDVPLLRSALIRFAVEPAGGQWEALRTAVPDVVLAFPARGAPVGRGSVCDDELPTDVERNLVSATASSGHELAATDHGGEVAHVEHERPEDWGWHQEFKVLPRVAAGGTAVTMVLFLIGNHEGKVEDLWLLGVALIAMAWVGYDTIRRRNAWRN